MTFQKCHLRCLDRRIGVVQLLSVITFMVRGVAQWRKSEGQNMVHAEKNPVSDSLQEELKAEAVEYKTSIGPFLFRQM